MHHRADPLDGLSVSGGLYGPLETPSDTRPATSDTRPAFSSRGSAGSNLEGNRHGSRALQDLGRRFLVEGGNGTPTSQDISAAKQERSLPQEEESPGAGGACGAYQATTPAGATVEIASNNAATARKALDLVRPESPLLQYVDRASMPGYVDRDRGEPPVKQEPLVRDRSFRRVPQAEDEWDKELKEWMKKYGCAVDEPEGVAAEVGAPNVVPISQLGDTAATVDVGPACEAGGKNDTAPMLPRGSVLDAPLEVADMSRRSIFEPPNLDELPERKDLQPRVRGERGSIVCEVPLEPASEGVSQVDVPMANVGDVMRSTPSPPGASRELPARPQEHEPETRMFRGSVLDVDIMDEEMRRASMLGIQPPEEFQYGAREGIMSGSQAGHSTPGSARDRAATNSKEPVVKEPTVPEEPAPVSAMELDLRAEMEAVAHPVAVEVRPTAIPVAAATAPERTAILGSSPLVGTSQGRTMPRLEWDLEKDVEVDKTLQHGRYTEYTAEDLAVATEDAKRRLAKDSGWTSGYSEANLQKRDYFQDLRKQRDRDKGRQATGPLWAHLASQAKNFASEFDLYELLESLKLFSSVRLDDYELYMRLLGEVPRFVAQATSDQLATLVRILARRRLRERNYVDMCASYLAQKLRVTNDYLPIRTLVKTANAFAALECRSNPRFVEHFLRHIEHRIEELDATLCCLVSPLFVVSYMSDALRRAYLKRCAETQAGFHGPLDDCRTIACTEFALRKEHHSLVSSLPAYVTRYLEKVSQHAQFDKWGAVMLPAPSAPDGPKGKQKSEMSVGLQRKATTAAGGNRVDIFSSEMHRDVSACLTHLGVEHENGVLCGPFLLDVVAMDMVNPAKRIVYEVNSPHHYYEATQTLTAEQRLRQRLLGRLGQKLHIINSEEWSKLTAAQKMTFVLKMQQAQQDDNTLELQQKAAANAARALPPAGDTASKPLPLVLKSERDPNKAPIRVPVPPSQRARMKAITQ